MDIYSSRKFLFPCLLLLCLLAHAQDDLEESILVATQDNFEEIRQNNANLLVFFYTTDNPLNKQFLSDLPMMAQVFKENELPITVAKVNFKENIKLAEQFYITQTPLFMLFKHGVKHLYYNGPLRTEDIFSWSTKVIHPPSRGIECEKLTNPEKAIHRLVVFYGDIEGEVYLNAFTDLAHHGIIGRTFGFVHITDDDCAKKIGFTQKPQMMMYREMVNPNPAIYEGDWHPVTMIDWTWAQVTPTVFEFNQANYELVYYQKMPQIVLFRMLDWDDKEEYEIVFEEVAAKNKGDYIFLTSGMSEQIQQQFASLLGIEYKDLPTVRILDIATNLKYKFPQDVNTVTRKQLQNFLDDFEDLQLEPYFRSGPVPDEQKSVVQQVVGDTQIQVIHDKNKDVMVLYWAPWCEECKNFMPTFEELATKLQEIPDLTFVTFDVSQNDPLNVNAEQLPNIMFYFKEDPEATKKKKIKSRATYYHGDREVEPMIEFLSIVSDSYQQVHGVPEAVLKQREEEQKRQEWQEEQAKKNSGEL